MNDIHGYSHPALRNLNSNEINWDAPRTVPCKHCEERLGLDQPCAGSYASTMRHYESFLGLLPDPRSQARVLIIFQDPRNPNAGEKFEVCGPLEDGRSISKAKHRYFCLSQVAWDNLELGRWIGQEHPCWPQQGKAHHYLRNYFRLRNTYWSYDAFLAYVLFQLRVKDTYVTNLGKCHFGEQQTKQIYQVCASSHLAREIAVLAPNGIISFCSRVPDLASLERVCGTRIRTALFFLSLLHPASRKGHVAKYLQFLNEIAKNADGLRSLGVRVESLKMAWRQDVRTLLPTLEPDLPGEDSVTMLR